MPRCILVARTVPSPRSPPVSHLKAQPALVPLNGWLGMGWEHRGGGSTPEISPPGRLQHVWLMVPSLHCRRRGRRGSVVCTFGERASGLARAPQACFSWAGAMLLFRQGSTEVLSGDRTEFSVSESPEFVLSFQVERPGGRRVPVGPCHRPLCFQVSVGVQAESQQGSWP